MAALAVAFGFAACPKAAAQVAFGVKGGYNIDKFTLSKDVLDVENRYGFFIGPTIKVSLPVPLIGIDAAVLYDQSKTEVGGLGITRKYVNIPVNARLNIGLGSSAGIFLFAGPQAGFNVGGTDFHWNEKESYRNTFQLKKSIFSVNAGAGITLMSHLQASVNYNIPLGNTAEIKAGEALQQAADNIADGKSGTVQIALAYYF